MKKYYLVYETGKLEEVTSAKYAEAALSFGMGFSSVAYMVEESPELSLEENND